MPRKKKKKLSREAVPRDWTVDPNTQREIIAIFLLVSGALFLLSSLNLAGNLGEALLGMLRYLFGFLGYFISVVFILLGGGLLLNRINFKASKTVGLIVAFLAIPTLFHPYGGAIGALAGIPLNESVGTFAAVILALAFSIMAILLATETSLVKLFNLNPDSEASEADAQEGVGVKINDQSVPVMNLGSIAKSGFRLPFGKKGANNSTVASVPSPKVVPITTVKTRDKNWTLPSLDLLETSTTRSDPGNVNKNVTAIEKTLKDFGILVSMGEVNVGPTVTQYTLKPAEGVKLNQITARSNDLALALAAHPIRVEAPIPGKAAVGVEIPNKVKAIVSLKEILASEKFKTEKSNLVLAMGRDVAGEPVTIDLSKAPHVLIAGATGSGKSVAINSVLMSLLYQNAPADLRLLLIDPKRVEFSMYNDIPHLLAPVITDSDKTISALKWAVAEMERRYKVFETQHKRNLAEYNAANAEEHMPYVVIVIDELADLMAQSANEVEGAIVRIAQMARAVGIHLIVATQRPSVDVITGLIKANITTRIAFAVASQIDSRTILDQAGAERLLGNGDMLYLGAESPQPRRIQGVFVSSKEVDAITKFLRDAGPAEYDEQVLIQKSSAGKGRAGGIGGDIDEPNYEEAKELVIQSGKASASLLQRRLRVGYARAARLLDILEDQGIIGPADGAKPRQILQDSYSFSEPVEADSVPVVSMDDQADEQNRQS